MELCRTTLAATFAAALLFASPSDAAKYRAPKGSGKSKVILLDPLAFLKVEDLSFGSYLVPSVGSITIAIDAGTGTVTPTPNAIELPNSLPQRGWLLGSGDAGQTVTVSAVLPDKLYRNGDTLGPSLDVLLNLDKPAELDGSYNYTVAADKTFNIYIGGLLSVNAGQTSGDYEGDFAITATYE